MLDGSFFTHYDRLGEEAHTLAHADSSLATAKAARDRCAQELQHAQNELRKNIAFTKEQKDRIELVSSHWFYGTTALQPQLWFRGGTQGKISRAKAKLERSDMEYPACVEKVRVIEVEKLPPLQMALDISTGQADRKHAIDAERVDMYERAVSSAPSPTYLAMQGQDAQLAQSIAAGQSNAMTLHEIAAWCIEGKSHYGRAARLTNEARGLNRAAANEHRHQHPVKNHRRCPNSPFEVTFHPTHCCARCANNPGQHGPKCQQKVWVDHEKEAREAKERERLEQEMRDRKMREAQHEADKGAEVLRRAFASVPGYVRERYPAQCAAFAAVEVPQLAQNHAGTKMMEFFGGEAGNLLAEWQSGDKLRQNLAVIQRCEAVASQQEAIVRQLENQVRAETDAAINQKAQLAVAINQEKQRIFDELRVRIASGGMGGGAAVAQAVPMATPIATPMAVPQASPMAGAAVPMGSPIAQAAPVAQAYGTNYPQAAPVS